MKRSDAEELANVMWHEARGEPRVGQIAVGYVVLNRVRHNRYPNTVPGVCWQPYQFQNLRWHDKSIRLVGLAEKILKGEVENPIGERRYFRSNSRRKGLRIGGHVFF